MDEKRKSLWRQLLEGWTVIAARFGAVQTLVILALFYVTLIGPVSIVQAIGRSDHLDKRRMREGGSAWNDAQTAGADFERAKLLT